MPRCIGCIRVITTLYTHLQLSSLDLSLYVYSIILYDTCNHNPNTLHSFCFCLFCFSNARMALYQKCLDPVDDTAAHADESSLSLLSLYMCTLHRRRRRDKLVRVYRVAIHTRAYIHTCTSIHAYTYTYIHIHTVGDYIVHAPL